MRGSTTAACRTPEALSSTNASFTNASGNSYEGMTIHYAGISGATPDPAGRVNVCTGDVFNNSSSCNTGLLVPLQSKSIRDCTDGTSNSMLVVEHAGYDSHYVRGVGTPMPSTDLTLDQPGAWYLHVRSASLGLGGREDSYASLRVLPAPANPSR